MGRGIKKSVACGRITPGSGRGNGILKGQSKNELHPSQYGIGRKALNDLELLHTDTLVKEVSWNTFTSSSNYSILLLSIEAMKISIPLLTF